MAADPDPPARRYGIKSNWPLCLLVRFRPHQPGLTHCRPQPSPARSRVGQDRQMPRDDWAKYARRDLARKAIRTGTALKSAFGGILKRPKGAKPSRKPSSGNRPNKPLRDDRQPRKFCVVCCHPRRVLDANSICTPCHSNGRATQWLRSQQPGPVDRRALSQASIQADPPAAGTDRHDALCQIPDHVNGVSSRGLPAHALAPDVQAGQPHANGPDSTRTERAARCDQSVSGTYHDEDTRERPGASSLTDLAG